jgi:hypothetical protein
MLVCMRTTINLPDALGEAAKAKAAAEGRTLTSLIEEGLRTVLDGTGSAAEPGPLPTFGDPGGRFLIDLADRDAVESALDADGLR